MKAENVKEGLGDSVYVDNDIWGIKLTTENGCRTTNTIYLDAEVYKALIEYVRRRELFQPTQP